MNANADLDRRAGEDRRADAVTYRELAAAFAEHDRKDTAVMGSIDEKLSEIRDCLYGDESDGKPGLKLRVDRLHQAQRTRDWWHATWAAALVGWLVQHFGSRQ